MKFLQLTDREAGTSLGIMVGPSNGPLKPPYNIILNNMIPRGSSGALIYALGKRKLEWRIMKIFGKTIPELSCNKFMPSI